MSEPVRTVAGLVSSSAIQEAGVTLHVYRGIPYAAPPVGDLRWKPPQPPVSWDGVRECTEYSVPAPQNNLFHPATFEQSEDCLYLNVTTPAQKPTDKLPVIVWMHGGAYSFNTGNDPSYNLPVLPAHGVVLVTVNMRLDALGMLAHPLLSEESSEGVSGNYLFLDMIASLEWVRDNIAAFGGDPDCVTIASHSLGSIKIANLMVSPLAEGLFHRAVLTSGMTMEGFYPGVPLEEMEAAGEKVFAELGVDKEADPLAAARALPWETIMEAGKTVSFDAAIDGWVLETKAYDILKNGAQKPVPFIVIANLGEITGPALPGFLLPELPRYYTDILTGAANQGINGYAALFEHVPGQWKKEGGVATHMMELPYILGDFSPDSLNWMTLASLEQASGIQSPDPGLTEADRQLSDDMMSLLVQFARTGNPAIPGLTEWPAYEPAGDEYLGLDIPLRVKSGYSNLVQLTPKPTYTTTTTTTETKPEGFRVTGSLQRTDLVYTSEPVTENDIWTGEGIAYFDIHGKIEGTVEIVWHIETDTVKGTRTGYSESIFNCTIDGKQGTFTTKDTDKGQTTSANVVKYTRKSEIISGTDELANLRGTITFQMTQIGDNQTGDYSGILNFEEAETTKFSGLPIGENAVCAAGPEVLDRPCCCNFPAERYRKDFTFEL